MNHFLKQEIRYTLAAIERQADLLVDQANRSSTEVKPEELRDANGNYLITPLLVAKSNCLLALSNLEAQR